MQRNKVPFLFLFAAFHLLIFSSSFSQAPKKVKTIIVDAGHGGAKDPGAIGQYENSLRSREKDITLAISLKLIDELKKQMPDVNVVPTRTTDIYQDPREKARIANEAHGDLFLCIHADSGPLKQGRRQIGTRTVTRYRVTGKGKKRKRIPYQAEEPVYEYFKYPLTRSGTSVWIFAAHKTSDKLKAIMDGDETFEIEANGVDSLENNFDFGTPEGRIIASIYAKRFQERSDRLATGRQSLGVSQRQKGIWVLQATNMPAILIETGFINNPEDERYLNSEKGQQELAEAITKAVKRYKEQVESINNNGKPSTNGNGVNKPKPDAIPEAIEKRPVKDVKVLEVKSNKIRVDLFDDGEIDNDIVSVYFNNALLVDKKSITAQAHTFTLSLAPAKTNELVLVAENLGTIPPNTALMVITDGTTRHEVRLSADMKNNASVRFELRNNN
jgi:N-acetylmuramoyl-L-alanine amidase